MRFSSTERFILPLSSVSWQQTSQRLHSDVSKSVPDESNGWNRSAKDINFYALVCPFLTTGQNSLWWNTGKNSTMTDSWTTWLTRETNTSYYNFTTLMRKRGISTVIVFVFITFLGMLVKLRKATMSFVMSVRLSVRPSVCPPGNNSAPTEWILTKNYIAGFF